MLVFSRHRDETIMIGDDIEVTVIDIRGDKVRLGTTAPRTVSVHRKEVYDAIRRENSAAAKVNTKPAPVQPPELPGEMDVHAAQLKIIDAINNLDLNDLAQLYTRMFPNEGVMRLRDGNNMSDHFKEGEPVFSRDIPPGA